MNDVKIEQDADEVVKKTKASKKKAQNDTKPKKKEKVQVAVVRAYVFSKPSSAIDVRTLTAVAFGNILEVVGSSEELPIGWMRIKVPRKPPVFGYIQTTKVKKM